MFLDIAKYPENKNCIKITNTSAGVTGILLCKITIFFCINQNSNLTDAVSYLFD